MKLRSETSRAQPSYSDWLQSRVLGRQRVDLHASTEIAFTPNLSWSFRGTGSSNFTTVTAPSGARRIDPSAPAASPVESNIEKLRFTPDDPVRSRFRELVEEWHRACRFSSSVTARVQHPAYRAIVALGRPVLPYLLEEMIARPNHWSSALIAITGTNPVPPAARGSLDEVAASWRSWAAERGLL